MNKMSKGTFRIVVQEMDEFFNDMKKDLKTLERKGKIRNEKVLALPLKEIYNILSGKRLELLRILSNEEIKSIYALAKRVDRNTKNVYDDVHLLKKYDLIEDISSNGKRIIKPKYKELLVNIPM